jgi:iron complex outermembrane receptor protein
LTNDAFNQLEDASSSSPTPCAPHKLSKNIELFGLANNLLHMRDYAAGTFTQTNGGQGVFNSNTSGDASFLNISDPRTFAPGMPFAALAGVWATF